MKDPATDHHVPIARLRWQSDPADLDFESSADLEPTDDIIGQDRAMKAIRLGLDLRSFGYNIFITGLVGTGRMTVIQRFLSELGADGDVHTGGELRDLCYVHNFTNPDAPRLISLPPGQGGAFDRALQRLVHTLRHHVPQIFESEAYGRQRKTLIQGYRTQQSQIIDAFQSRVQHEGFAVIQVQMGPITRPHVLPAIEGEAVPMEQLDSLVQEGKLESTDAERMRQQYAVLVEELGTVSRQMQVIERKVQEEVEGLNRGIVREALHDVLEEIRSTFPTDAVKVFLDEVEHDVLENVRPGLETDDEDESEDPTHFYGVNVVVANTRTKTVPVVSVTHPTHADLFGAIEAPSDRDRVTRADFSHVRAGALMRADGGFLVLNGRDVLQDPSVWAALKRSLRTGLVEVRVVETGGYPWGTALKPEPVAIRTKVVIIGDAQMYSLLYALDEDFRKIFKIKAEFDAEMPRTPGATQQYARFVAKICRSESLPPFDRGAVGQILEYGVRRAGHQDKLSTHFTFVKDVIVEAAYWARESGSDVVRGEHVDRAIDESIARVNLVERKLKAAIERGEILIETSGDRVGQVNGLAVYGLGDHSFGVPTKITTSVGAGRTGIVNIEREADMSGATHDKGVLILQGFFRERFAREKPLALSASLCFEQSYSGVDGDSASSTEVYALMSALSGLPIRQGIAVTGSVNQKGEIQPIGGVNEKIEGFFDVCRARGLSGDQGVLIPEQNVPHLMLREPVVEAVRDRTFAVYAVRTVDEGIQILTGVAAGEADANGRYPAASVNGRIAHRLDELADRAQAFGAGETL